MVFDDGLISMKNCNVDNKTMRQSDNATSDNVTRGQCGKVTMRQGDHVTRGQCDKVTM